MFSVEISFALWDTLGIENSDQYNTGAYCYTPSGYILLLPISGAESLWRCHPRTTQA